MVSRFGTETSPSSGSSSPTIMRNSVVLPDPFGPTSPTRSPGFNWNEASTKTSCLPYCLWMEEREIIADETVKQLHSSLAAKSLLSQFAPNQEGRGRNAITK